MISELSQLAVSWMKKSSGGKGLRLTPAQLDLLNAIGVGELVAFAAAEAISKQCLNKRHLATSEADISLSRTSDATELSARRFTKSSGTTNSPDEIAAAQRARLRVSRPKRN